MSRFSELETKYINNFRDMTDEEMREFLELNYERSDEFYLRRKRKIEFELRLRRSRERSRKKREAEQKRLEGFGRKFRSMCDRWKSLGADVKDYHPTEIWLYDEKEFFKWIRGGEETIEEVYERAKKANEKLNKMALGDTPF